ncbi:ABC transporter permease [Wenzhouxiangella marina]|uniref:Peptide ABC transporter permease n=1 Tax=Wenzhouxiangella marina TaxID=1579979 RepID=A0A0K0XS87_9GAMM|nr:ABC transporter permease [Wenzhouxiangella marina]AKS40486.1 Peptide ABC transporter permease [Wenzhouxiangella marina]MBB6088192.1 putative ABC transport system permease protein [Wenzhouxiangella marina]
MNTTRETLDLETGGVNLNASLRIAVRAIRTNAVRSLLTMLGIVIGIGAAIVSVSISQGAGEQLKQQIAAFGTHTLQVRPGASFFGGRSRGAGSARPLTDRDVQAIRENSDWVEAASGLIQSNVTLVADGRNWSSTAQGIDADYPVIQDWSMTSGRMFESGEVRSAAKVAVIGQTVANELFGGADPIGSRIRVGRTPVTVIGVLEEKGASSWGQDQDDVVWVPITTMRRGISRGSTTVPDDAGRLYIKIWDDLDVLEAQQVLEEQLRIRRDLQPGAEDDFAVINFAEFIRARNETEALLGFLLAAFSATSLIVGGIGIMNIMLVSVTERTREIGLRLAIGARQRDVLTQFLVEATVLGLLGGVLGMLLGVGGAHLASHLGEFPILIGPSTLVGAVLIACVIAIFFGYYPARRASRLEPIEALRFE